MGVSWKGSISFGLIYIPVSLYVASSEENIGFNLLHKECNHKISYKKVCEFCKEELKSDEIIKGYNYENDKYVIFTDDDFEKIKSTKDKSIIIEQFINADEIDPILYDKAYNVIPDGGEKAFELLKRAMSDTNKVGIAKVVFGSKENLIALRVNKNNMLLNKLFYVDEIKIIQSQNTNITLNQSEIDLAKQLINNMTAPFSPEKYHNEYNEKLKAAIAQKINGEEINIPKDIPANNIINLMEALQESLKATQRPVS